MKKHPLLIWPGLLLASVAYADSIPDELVVSGYRPANSRELGTSISVIDNQSVARATVSGFEQVVQLVPNMNFSGEASRARYFQLRGVGEREQYEGAPNPSVGFVIDDIDLSGIGGVASTFDIRQVEVLRGPQSARYGSSALAGMIYMQTEQPDDAFSLHSELTGGSDDTRAIGLAVGAGLTDRLAGRLAIHRYQDNGFRDNLYLGRDDTNGRDELTVRGKLNWDIRDGWSALLTVLMADFDNGYDAWSLRNNNKVWSDQPGRDEQNTQAASLRIRGPLYDSADLVSITTVADSDIVFGFDADWANPTTFLPAYQVAYSSNSLRERKTWSQEWRLVSTSPSVLAGHATDWTVGLFLQRLQEDNDLVDPGNYVDFDPFSCPLPGCSGRREVSSQYEAKTVAIFGSTETELGERWSLSLGMRVERWDAEYFDRWFDNNLFDINFNPIPVDGNNAFSPTETMLGGHVSISYDWSGDLRAYARLARGFKAGGFNPSLAAFVRAGVTGPYGGELVPYTPEYSWNYELGLKGVWMDGDLNADLNIFYMDRDDAQLSQSDQLDNPSSFIYVTANGAAESYGLEADAQLRLSDSLELHATLGLLRTEIHDWQVRPSVEGRDLAHAPRFTANLGITWTHPQDWYVRADIRTVGSYFFDISHDQKSHRYRLVNLRVGKDWTHWSASLWGRNIFDRKYATRGFYFVNEPPYTQPPVKYTKFGDPRQIGLTVKYRY